MLVKDKHWLIVPTHKSQKNYMLQIHTQGLHLQHFIFFVTYELAPLASVLHYSRLEMLFKDKHWLIVPTHKSHKKLHVANTHPGAVFTTLYFLRNL